MFLKRNSGGGKIGTKLVLVALLAFLFMIPTGVIMGMISEREGLREEMVEDIKDKWGGSQRFVGPILTIPYKEIVPEVGNLQQQQTSLAKVRLINLFPKKMDIKGNVEPEVLSRGIFNTTVFKTDLSLSGVFDFSELEKLSLNDQDILWESAFISMNFSDTAGIQKKIEINLNDQELELVVLSNSSDIRSLIKDAMVKKGLSVFSFDDKFSRNNETFFAPIDFSGVADFSKSVSFFSDLSLSGSDYLNFVPIAGENNISLTSTWASPGFVGKFLPDDRKITNEGFEADWKILSVNTRYPAYVRGSIHNNFYDRDFGVRFVELVNHYQKTTRAVKYSLLLIGLTFLTFFFVEVFNKIRLHPVQYVLVGAALVLFFILLLALSEHMLFNLAYLFSAIGTFTLVSLYSKAIFKKNKLVLLNVFVLLISYSFIFVLLQLVEYALLAGSIGLFVVLGVIMFVSRNVDWYEV